MSMKIFYITLLIFFTAGCSDDTSTPGIVVEDVTKVTQQSVIKPAVAGEAAEKLIYGFCYALQASGSCTRLSIRLDTRGKIQEKVGFEFDKQGEFYLACSEGVYSATEDQLANEAAVCKTAWSEYGCYGSKIAGLLQEDPFTVTDGIRCQYK